jgi:cytoskeletal protein CcmA (bactofilin family)
MATAAAGEFSHIGRSVFIKGEISGTEDIYVDGHVEGRVQLSGNSLTVGPNGRVQADIVAKNVTVGGSLEGNIQASERTEMRKTAVVNGDVQTRRIAIEEGAYFKGRLEILMEADTQAASAAVAAAANSPVLQVSVNPQLKK